MQIWCSALGVPKIMIDEKITPSLLGGIQVRIASCMIDLSVNKKLQQINQMPVIMQLLEHLIMITTMLHLLMEHTQSPKSKSNLA